MKYLRRKNILIEIEIEEFSLAFHHYDLDTKTYAYEYRAFHSEREMNDKINTLKKTYKVLDAIDKKLKKEIENYISKYIVESQIYRKERLYIVGNSKQKRLFFIDLDKDYKYKGFENGEDLQKALKKETTEYTLVKADELSDEEIFVIDFMIRLEDDSEEKKERETVVKYQEQFSKDFPFFGAGNATYFESICLTIYFDSTPSENQKKKILKLLPSELNTTLDDFEGAFLTIYMEYGYDAMETIFENNFDKLNTRIEKALLTIHKLQPIIFVYRAEDTEASGTNFSKWHTQSGDMLKSTIEKIEAKLTYLDYDEIINIKGELKEIFNLYGLKGKDKNRFRRKIWNPQRPVINTEELLIKLKNENKVNAKRIEDVLYKIYNDDVYEEDTFYRLFLANNAKDYREKFLQIWYISEIIFYAKKVKDTETISFFKQKIIIENFNKFNYYTFPSKDRYIKFATAYLPLLPDKSTLVENTIINNVLYNFISVNELNIPVDFERNSMLLKKALHYAPDNPSIYYNASIMYSEMNEIAKAYDCINKSFDYKLNKKSSYSLLDELKAGNDELKNLSKDKNFQTFIAEFQAKLDNRFAKPENVHKDATICDSGWIYQSETEEIYWYKKGKLLEKRTYLKPRKKENNTWTFETYDYETYHKDGTLKEKGRSKGGYYDFNRESIGKSYFCIGKKKYKKNKQKGKKFNWYTNTSHYDEKGKIISDKYFDIDGIEIFK